MKRILSMTIAMLLCLSPALVSAELAGTVSGDYEPLYQFAEPYGFYLGGAFGYWDMNNKTRLQYTDNL